MLQMTLIHRMSMSVFKDQCSNVNMIIDEDHHSRAIYKVYMKIIKWAAIYIQRSSGQAIGQDMIVRTCAFQNHSIDKP
jgi:hypothetical protein